MAYFLYYAGYEKSSGLEQIGLATSMDLHTWKRVSPKPIIPAGSAGECDIEQTSNPCVLKHEGRFKMWYQGRSSSGAASVCFAESPDGIVWQVKKGPVLAPAGEGYRVGYHQPHVLFNEAKSCFQMWVTLHDGSASKIVYAESSDGLSWNFLENNAVAPEGEQGAGEALAEYLRARKDLPGREAAGSDKK